MNHNEYRDAIAGRLRGSKANVLNVFLRYSDYKTSTNSRPSIKTVAEKCGLKERQTRKIVKELVADGFLVQCKRGGGKLASVYDLTIPAEKPIEETANSGKINDVKYCVDCNEPVTCDDERARKGGIDKEYGSIHFNCLKLRAAKPSKEAPIEYPIRPHSSEDEPRPEYRQDEFGNYVGWNIPDCRTPGCGASGVLRGLCFACTKGESGHLREPSPEPPHCCVDCDRPIRKDRFDPLAGMEKNGEWLHLACIQIRATVERGQKPHIPQAVRTNKHAPNPKPVEQVDQFSYPPGHPWARWDKTPYPNTCIGGCGRHSDDCEVFGSDGPKCGECFPDVKPAPKECPKCSEYGRGQCFKHNPEALRKWKARQDPFAEMADIA
ncbi:helix-turn-helix domain-containing protein [Mycobacterium sp. SMC-2]|uniref:helix-turn-helix domain-containing protein n=1 Tax=Mycobacterium sp. SMC-2 TaxID=2857058 RepID=UPI0021B27EE5|nr:helix-turn-helix domain-containing protein [Mycobacterium sp. SMC-2]UXA08673.1 helix-turn-helix domain-containing protein [Mycobacterium sp. SMC-2]